MTHSEGEYWLAVDGQYLVKYLAVIEAPNTPEDDPDAEVMGTEFKMEVTEINQPLTISLPSECK